MSDAAIFAIGGDRPRGRDRTSVSKTMPKASQGSVHDAAPPRSRARRPPSGLT